MLTIRGGVGRGIRSGHGGFDRRRGWWPDRRTKTLILEEEYIEEHVL